MAATADATHLAGVRVALLRLGAPVAAQRARRVEGREDQRLGTPASVIDGARGPRAQLLGLQPRHQTLVALPRRSRLVVRGQREPKLGAFGQKLPFDIGTLPVQLLAIARGPGALEEKAAGSAHEHRGRAPAERCAHAQLRTLCEELNVKRARPQLPRLAATFLRHVEQVALDPRECSGDEHGRRCLAQRRSVIAHDPTVLSSPPCASCSKRPSPKCAP